VLICEGVKKGVTAVKGKARRCERGVQQKLRDAGIPQVVGRKAACGFSNLGGQPISSFLMHSHDRTPRHNGWRKTYMRKGLEGGQRV
jgi:hypothetical protein